MIFSKKKRNTLYLLNIHQKFHSFQNWLKVVKSVSFLKTSWRKANANGWEWKIYVRQLWIIWNNWNLTYLISFSCLLPKLSNDIIFSGELIDSDESVKLQNLQKRYNKDEIYVSIEVFNSSEVGKCILLILQICISVFTEFVTFINSVTHRKYN